MKVPRREIRHWSGLINEFLLNQKTERRAERTPNTYTIRLIVERTHLMSDNMISRTSMEIDSPR